MSALYTRPLKRGGVRHASVVVFTTQRRRYAEDKFGKKYHFWPPIWRPLRYRHHIYGTELYVPSCTFSRHRRDIFCRRANKPIHISLIGDFPEGLPSHVIQFWKALAEPMLRPVWHVTRGTYPQRLNFVSGTHLPSCKISRRSVSPSPRYL